MKTKRSARSGWMYSLNTSFKPSARVCMMPHGPRSALVGADREHRAGARGHDPDRRPVGHAVAVGIPGVDVHGGATGQPGEGGRMGREDGAVVQIAVHEQAEVVVLRRRRFG